MRHLLNQKGLALAAIIVIGAAFMVVGLCATKTVEHWKEAQPPVKKVHYRVIKGDPAVDLMGYECYDEDQTLIDFAVPMPDTEGK